MLATAPSDIWIPQSPGLQLAASGDVERFYSPLEVKAIDQAGRTIEAYVAAFGDPVTAQGADRNRDIIVKGAFANSLATKRAVPLIGHDLEALRVGRLVEAHEDEYGLYTKTYVYETTAGNDLLETARQSLIEQDPLGNSIGYKVVQFSQAFIRGVVYRVLKQIDWVEYSFLATRNIAANPAARTLSVKSLVPTIRGPEERDMVLTNPEARAALIEQRKAFGMSDTDGVDLALIAMGEQLTELGTRAISDLLAMRQLGLETKADQRMSPTVFTSVQDLWNKVGEIIGNQPSLDQNGAESEEASLPEELNDCLAMLTDLAVSYKQAHWNVTGPLFPELHQLFDGFAWVTYDAADLVAERIVQLGSTAQGTIQAAVAGSGLPPFPVDSRDAGAIVAALVGRIDILAEYLEDLAEDLTGDLTTQNLLLDVSQRIAKQQWQLRATNGQLAPPADADDDDQTSTMAAKGKPETKGAVPGGDGSGDDDTMAARKPLDHKTAPKETGTPGGAGSDALPYSRDSHQASSDDPAPAAQARNRGGEPSAANAALGGRTRRKSALRKKAAPPEHGTPGAYDPAGMSTPGHETASANEPPETKAKPPMPEYQGESKDFHDETKWAPEMKAAVDQYMRERSAAELSKVKHFAWDDDGDQSYPIEDATDVANAARAIGRLKGGKASDSDRARLKENIIRLAKQVGGESGLPSDWKALEDLEKPEEKKAAPPESNLGSNDDMNAKALSEGSDEGGGFLARKSEVDVEAIDLGLMALSVGVSIRG